MDWHDADGRKPVVVRICVNEPPWKFFLFLFCFCSVLTKNHPRKCCEKPANMLRKNAKPAKWIWGWGSRLKLQENALLGIAGRLCCEHPAKMFQTKRENLRSGFGVVNYVFLDSHVQSHDV